MQNELTNLEKNAAIEIEHAKSQEELKNAEVRYLGRSGELTSILKKLKNLPHDQKAEIGRKANMLKKHLEELIEIKQVKLTQENISAQLENEWVDVTAPGIKPIIGHIHPLSQVQMEVEHIFSQMGFSIMDGPEVESEYYNFETLNIPTHHPARDMQDTFFIDQNPDQKHGRLVLRTHTSPVQVRTMERLGAPLRIIVPGRTFRNEATDARHEHTFYQIEGLLIDTDISLASLKGVMHEFLSRFFNKETKIRFRPGYFPFVEPGLELDCSCLLCNEKGCRVCKGTGWLEMMGAGMVHTNVLKAGGIDPEKYQGWAFGFGLNRLVMLKYQIDDIRLFMSGNLRFLTQF